MTAHPHRPAARLSLPALDRLMPMHLRLDVEGRILSVGPTLAKLLRAPVVGNSFAAHFALCRPALPATVAALLARAGQRIHLALLPDQGLTLRGLAVPAEEGGVILNLSFGIGVTEAVRRHALTVADFAATDLTVEMLYLVEAKSAVMGELRSLNLRLHGAKMAAEHQALTDTLTGLRNRRALDMRLADLVAHGPVFALMHLDLDFFKQVNDTLGHAAGDHVLREVARILGEETRASDMAARVGGDEFVLLFPGLADPERLSQIARRIIERLTLPMEFEGQTCRISGSIGMTLSSHYDRPDAEQMLSDADEALYTSKRAGRGRASLTAVLPKMAMP